MDKTEVKTNEVIVESIDKLIGKYQKRADRERTKVKQASITYKGEIYCSEQDIMDAYACDVFTEATCDRLIKKLDKAKNGISGEEMTESEMIVLNLNKHKSNLLQEIADDKKLKEKEAQTQRRIRKLMKEGYSYREAETITGNEELMRYE